MQEQALAAGYAVVDQTSIVATHLAEIVRSHAHELLTRQETKRLLDALAQSQPKLVEELVPKLLSLGEVQKVLQQLLREQVSIRDLPRILETLVDNAPMTKSTVHQVEACRQALGRSLVQSLVSEDGKLRVLALDPAFEDEVARAFDPAAAGRAAAVQPTLVERVLGGLKKMVGDRATMEGTILLCSSPARFHLRRLLEPFMPRVTVLSPGEIPASVTVQSLGVVE